MKKKVLALIVALLMMLTVILTACGKAIEQTDDLNDHKPSVPPVVVPQDPDLPPPLDAVDRDIYLSRESVLEKLSYYEEIISGTGRVTIFANQSICEDEYGADAKVSYSLSLFPHSDRVKISILVATAEGEEELNLIGDTFYNSSGELDALFIINDNYVLLSDFEDPKENLFAITLTLSFTALLTYVTYALVAVAAVAIFCLAVVFIDQVVVPFVQDLISHPRPWPWDNPATNNPPRDLPTWDTPITISVPQIQADILDRGQILTMDLAPPYPSLQTDYYPVLVLEDPVNKIEIGLLVLWSMPVDFQLAVALVTVLGSVKGGVFTYDCQKAKAVALAAFPSQPIRHEWHLIAEGSVIFPHWHPGKVPIIHGGAVWHWLGSCTIDLPGYGIVADLINMLKHTWPREQDLIESI